uniref:Uncharacterized protein n=1 Tax=Rhizophora mucronata TaxID=61149 RepID=A0A2P2QCZ1_RHIMU
MDDRHMHFTINTALNKWPLIIKNVNREKNVKYRQYYILTPYFESRYWRTCWDIMHLGGNREDK